MRPLGRMRISEMTYRTRARSLAALVMAAIVLAAPLTALAKKGEKNYKLGLQYEQAQQWEKAAQEFALAVAARPSDTEYQLHYRRAIFNASQVFMQKGRTLADQGDYVGAYNAFRTAYGYDTVNELAANEMQRMLRLQREKEGLNLDGSVKNGARVVAHLVPPRAERHRPARPTRPAPRVEQFKNINYSGDLEPFIRQLADELEPQRHLRPELLAGEAQHQRPAQGRDGGAHARLHLPGLRPLLPAARPPHHPRRRPVEAPRLPAARPAHLLPQQHPDRTRRAR